MLAGQNAGQTLEMRVTWHVWGAEQDQFHEPQGLEPQLTRKHTLVIMIMVASS